MFNNPVNFVDPNGNTICSADGYCPHTDRGFSPYAFLSVNLATSIPQNLWGGREAAQYHYDPGELGVNPYPLHYNLCEHIALEMIYETITGKTNTLGAIYKASGTAFNEGSNYVDLCVTFAKTFPPGWTATAYAYSYITNYVAGNIKGDQTTLDHNWSHYNSQYVKALLFDMLSKGHYVVASVYLNTGMNGTLDPEGVQHWVVVNGMSGDGIFINNPFTNRPQYYTWDDFWSAFNYIIIEFISPLTLLARRSRIFKSKLVARLDGIISTYF